MPAVLISVGSNIDKEDNLPKAIELLRSHPAFHVVAVSPIYETAPVDAQGALTDQAWFYNAALWIETTLSPVNLRATLRAMEAAQGRVRTTDKAAPRTLDLDIIFYGHEQLTLGNRRIPDPDVIRFAYLALPLADIAPHWIHPDNELTLRQIANNLAHTEMETRKV
jgi:2-amino-4-hydroxy-6-hydroxymethyldihydropteridine diphosphokinase